jgi:hypothetical protein
MNNYSRFTVHMQEDSKRIGEEEEKGRLPGV